MRNTSKNCFLKTRLKIIASKIPVESHNKTKIGGKETETELEMKGGANEELPFRSSLRCPAFLGFGCQTVSAMALPALGMVVPTCDRVSWGEVLPLGGFTTSQLRKVWDHSVFHCCIGVDLHFFSFENVIFRFT